MLLNFPESNQGTAIVTSYTVHRKFFCYYIIADLEQAATFYNHKTGLYEKKKRVILKDRRNLAFSKFYNRSFSEVFVISIEDNRIMDIAEFTP
jgi:hypothetical protein